MCKLKPFHNDKEEEEDDDGTELIQMIQRVCEFHAVCGKK